MARVDYFPFEGGIDLTTPRIVAGAGRCMVARNYECDLYGGYKRIMGYERFDGKPSPTDTGAGDPAAIEAQRALIQAVPGSGAIRGVWVYRGLVAAFRDNAAGTACEMYISSSGGWVKVTTPVLLPGGKYEFVNYNFGGASTAMKMFGCDGVNPAFMFDGNGFTQIATGMANDAPNHIAAHKKHLFLSFKGGSIQHSAIGDPLTWSPILGAGEIAIGDECTGFEQQSGDALAIFARNHTHILHGTDSSNWNLQPFSRTTGCIPSTNQRLGNNTYFLDDRGVTSLAATQAFGNFVSDSISQQVQPIIDSLKPIATTSLLVRNKGQYRLFGNDGSGVIAVFSGNQLSGWTTVKFPNPVVCACSGEDSNGYELIFFGSDNGYVYQMEKGTSFDGQAIDASLRLHFNHMGAPRHRKRYRRLLIEQEGADEGTPITYQADFDYGNYTSGQGLANNELLHADKSYWNAETWNNFAWSNDSPGALNAAIDGMAKNIGVLIHSKLTYEQPYTLTGALIHYDVRRVDRGD